MRTPPVLFIGGPERLASVKIRCRDMAAHLGCAMCSDPISISDIPKGFSLYVCVKPRFDGEVLRFLSARGRVIWDIIDAPPPANLAGYIASTETARSLYAHSGQTTLIRHHHCNVERRTFDTSLRRVGWIGYPQWCPSFDGFSCDVYDARPMSREDVVDAHAKIGIGINARTATFDAHIHARLSAGIKLINCIGCGIPSISTREPGYVEIGEGCTLFVNHPSECAEAIRELESDHGLYRRLQACCKEKAEDFHLDTIAAQYRKLIDALA